MIPDFTAKKIEPQAPTRERLELMLKDPDLIDVVQGFIDKFKMPFRIAISDGTSPIDDKVYPVGLGVLRDTLSPGELSLQRFITVESSTIEMKDSARKISKTEHEVLICGETGTGKELIAKGMLGNRKGVLKAVNCAGFPEQLIEAELFGYQRGAFTGADVTKDGLMTHAADGVMFLDEIGELPLVMQAKLLRAIQEKRIRKVGSNKDEDISCKFVFATNRDLRKMVEDGQFRRDLYARISTLELSIKPLKPERMCDVIPICESLPGGDKFLERFGNELKNGLLDLSLNVRSIQQYVIRYQVLGKIN